MDAGGQTGAPESSSDGGGPCRGLGDLWQWARQLPDRIARWLLGIPRRIVQRLCKLAESLSAWARKAKWRSLGWWALLVVIAVVVGFALFGVLTALPWWVGIGLVGVGLIALNASVVSGTGRVIGAAIAGILTLAGVNWIVDKLFSWLGFGIPIVPGLLFATLVFAVSARGYLLLAGWAGPSKADVAVLLAVAVIIGLPLAVGLATRESAAHVPAANSTAPKVDVLIVTDGTRGGDFAAPAAGEPTLSGFDARYSVGVAVGDRVRWTLSEDEAPQRALQALARGADAPTTVQAPRPRPGASAVVLLDVDHTAPVAPRPEVLANVAAGHGEVPRWRRIARSVTSPSAGPIPAFALLQTNSRRRIADWRESMPKGGVLSRQAQTQTSLTAIGAAMAVGAPSADADYALALRFRPILLFDDGEAVPRPLSINWLFDRHKVQLCKDNGLKTDCTPADSPSQLKGGGTHLGLRLPAGNELRGLAFRDAAVLGVRVGVTGGRASTALLNHEVGAAPLGARELVSPNAPDQVRGGADTAIYVHPVADEHNGRQLLYLDYWWYLSDNPSGVGGGALCGAGMVIPGITCENHVSDWEGMTVVVDRTSAKPFIASVHYAEHKDVVAYGWPQLRHMWETDPEVPHLVRDVPGYAERPLAFVASGTHATYAKPCPSHCRQVASGLGEDDRDGDLPWIGDYTATCGTTSCVQVLPTYESGLHPALWDAFAGTWGDRDCILKYYCDLTTPPVAPGQQGRYAHPSRCSGIVNSSWKFEARQCEL